MANPISRRSALQAGAGGLLTGTLGAGSALAQAVQPVQPKTFATMDVVAADLKVPEGPVLGEDGTLIVSEIGRNLLTIIRPDGRKEQLAVLDGPPAGSAMGPDGMLYTTLLARTEGDKAINGKIVRLNLKTRQAEDVVTTCDGRLLRGPDDLIFDGKGGFYFTDVGMFSLPLVATDMTGIYYFDGTAARRVVGPTLPTNGIGLSPKGDRLYWTEYITGRLCCRDIVSPGVLREPKWPNGDYIYAHPTPITYFDSLKVDAEGCVSVAVHDHSKTGGKTGIMSFRADGTPFEFIPFPDPGTTNMVFTWKGPKTAYVTLSTVGHLVKLKWPRAGLPPCYPLPVIG